MQVKQPSLRTLTNPLHKKLSLGFLGQVKLPPLNSATDKKGLSLLVAQWRAFHRGSVLLDTI